MFTDAHCHPFDLLRCLPGAEACRRRVNTACAASSWNREQFEYHEGLKAAAKKDGAPPVFLCFAVHPQLPAGGEEAKDRIRNELLPLLETLAGEGRLDALGEAGFDLYSDEYRASETIQDEIFALQLETALRYGLPMVLHVRRAMHKIFAFTAELKKLPAVIFHSWPGTPGEGESLLRRGVNVYFSFGAPILTNHKGAQRCCAILPAERLLLETDAPYQPLRGRTFSSWQDLPLICRGAAELRKEAGSPGGTQEELEALIEANYFRAFQPDCRATAVPPDCRASPGTRN
jgi:TatD DNase family protein